nr:MAG TPA: endosialidase chaperone [Caudoviricetes sp.]
MVDYQYSNLFLKDSVDKQLNIVSDDGKINITNTELHQEKFELTESLCSESELTFGACEAGMIKFTVSNVFLPMKGKWLTAKMTLDGHEDKPFQIGRYKVYSDTPTADRTCRDVVAYDALYDILSSDVTDWYNQILPQKDSKVTLKQFRDSFFNHFGVEQEEVSLVNDEMIIEKTVEVKASSSGSSDTAETSTIGEAISGKEVLFCILEINGCMGNIGRVGKFRYVYLTQEMQGLYPANDLYPADDLYPRNPKSTSISKSQYISAQYEDYIVRTIDKLQIREKENDIGAIVGDGGNTYVIEGNFLVYGKGTKELNEIGEKTLSKIKGIIYRPFSADCKGNPCLEVGDAVRLTTKYELIETYILKRTLKGIQALRDDLEADGEEYRTSKVNGIQRSILQLKGKSNTLERSIEETKSTIVDVEKGLQSQITQTATEIRSEVKNTTDGLSSRITQNSESITAEVNRATNAEGTLSSKITQTAESITAEVNRATEKEGQLAAAIQINADGITSKVSRDSVVSEINQSAEGLKIRADLLELRGSVEMTGGYVHIDATESTDNLVELKREGTLVQMGTDGLKSVADTRELTASYSAVSVRDTSANTVAQMLSTGKGISSYGWESYSDKRLKHGIESLDREKSAALIQSLRPCRFVYNYDSAGHYRHGLIAQEVLTAIGDEDWAICSENPDPDGNTYYALDKTELIADLIATVQLQQEALEELKKKVG